MNNNQNTMIASINVIDALATNGELDAVRCGLVSAKHLVHRKRWNSPRMGGCGYRSRQPARCFRPTGQQGFSTSLLMSGPTRGSLAAGWVTMAIDRASRV